MSFFKITLQRLLHHLEFDVRKHARGVMNWTINDEGPIPELSIWLRIQDVGYIYTQEFNELNEIRIEIRSMLTSNRYVQAYLSEEKEPSQPIPPALLTPNLGLRLQADFLTHGAEQL